MKKISLYSLLFFFCSISSLQAQRHTLDSLLKLVKPGQNDTAQINVLNLAAIEYRNNNPDSALHYAFLAADYSKLHNYSEGRAAAYITIGTVLTNKGEIKEAHRTLEEGLYFAKLCKNKTLIARAYANTGNLYWRESKLDLATSSYMSALAIRKQTGDQLGVAGIYNNIALIHSNRGEYPEALESFTEAQKIYTEANDAEGMALAYNNIAVVYKLLGRNNDAITTYFKALRISEKNGDKVNIARCYGNIGVIYHQQGDYTEALKCLATAEKTFTEIGDQNGLGQTHTSIGAVKFSQKKYGEALVEHLKALEIRKKINDQFGMSASYNNIATVYSIQNDFDKAMEAYMQALKIKEAIGDKNGISNTNVNIGGVFLRQEKYSEAIPYFKKGAALAEEIGSPENIRDANKYLSQAYSKLGDDKNAFLSFEKYIVNRDSLINSENTKKTVQQQMQFDFDKKESIAKAEQQKKDELAMQQSQKEKMIRNFFIAGFFLVFLLAVFIYKGYRDKKKSNIIIDAKKREVEHQKELVEEKQKEIIDSISYAKRLQEAILPPQHFIEEYFPESFVFYKPKDIVAGDFYWMEVNKSENSEGKTEEQIFFAAADSTGHGVPGAMVSVVCSNALNRTVKEFNITEPGKILDKVRELVIETFEKSESEVRDGMDISLFSFDKNKMELKWAGANNPLWLVRNNELLDFHPDKQPIGKMDEARPFTTQAIPVQKGDSIYLFSDGYADQFGGPKGKKFKYKQLQETLIAGSSRSMREQSGLLKAKLSDWQGKLEQIDDILVIGIRL